MSPPRLVQAVDEFPKATLTLSRFHLSECDMEGLLPTRLQIPT